MKKPADKHCGLFLGTHQKILDFFTQFRIHNFITNETLISYNLIIIHTIFRHSGFVFSKTKKARI